MKKKKKQSEIYRILGLVAWVLVVLLMPFKNTQASITGGTGVPFGGRIITSLIAGYFVPPFGPYCPPHTIVFSIGGGFRGVMGFLLPPSQPKLFYNFFTTGTQELGTFTPVPLIVCPFYPVYPATIVGSSKK